MVSPLYLTYKLSAFVTWKTNSSPPDNPNVDAVIYEYSSTSESPNVSDVVTPVNTLFAGTLIVSVVNCPIKISIISVLSLS